MTARLSGRSKLHLYRLDPGHRWFDLVDRVPGRCGLQALVHVVDVFHTLGLQPFAEGFGALLGVDRDAVLPGGAAAEDSVELHSRLAGEFEGFRELGVAYARGQINKRLA